MLLKDLDDVQSSPEAPMPLKITSGKHERPPKKNFGYKRRSVQRKMLKACFSNTEALVTANEEPTLLGQANDVVLWHDPALQAATSKAMIYDSIKTKALTHQ
jgi:hypothetical protein